MSKEDFLNVIQTKFTDIVNNGRSIEIQFTIDKGSKIEPFIWFTG